MVGCTRPGGPSGDGRARDAHPRGAAPRPDPRAPPPPRRLPARSGAVSPRSREREETTDVAVKSRLKRMGKIRAPFYRVVVMDSRTKRDGRAIEEIGKYHPTAEPSVIEIDSDRAQHWLSTGAQPT